MIERTYFLHYRMVRESIANGVAIGLALLLGHLILWVRL